MARRVRVFIKDTAQHVVLKGLYGSTIFRDELDYIIFMSIIKDIRGLIDIHSYVLMPNYFEFVATPLGEDSLSKFMQSLGRRYVRYFNNKYNRRGTLWGGRYKSSIVEESYLLYVMRYIEHLPYSEGIVDEPTLYKYSSIHCNLLNERDNLISHHIVYRRLGNRDVDRIKLYSQIFYMDGKYDNFIERCLNKQLITGSLDYIKHIEQLVGLRLREKKRGRPKKIKYKGKRMYKRLVVLDKKSHKDLKVNPMRDLNFAKGVAFVPILAKEVELVGKEFPIVFTAGDNPSIVALVSLGGENLAINSDGKWITNYVPASIRKYPFAITSVKDNPKHKIILIDEESPLVSVKDGNSLFMEDGSQSDILKRAIKFLSDYDRDMEITKRVAKIIESSGVLEEREISIGEGDEKHILVNGFKVVNRDKLNNLSDDILANWVRKGFITLIDAHIKSLNGIDRLFDLAQKRQS